jgi:hypothetical protein
MTVSIRHDEHSYSSSKHGIRVKNGLSQGILKGVYYSYLFPSSRGKLFFICTL